MNGIGSYFVNKHLFSWGYKTLSYMKISWNIEIQIMKKNYKNELKDGVIFCNLLGFCFT